MKPISFRGFELQEGAYRVTDSGELFDSPQRQIIAQELARADNAVAVYRRYKSRDFVLAGTIRETSSAALESAIDALKLALLQQTGEVAAAWGNGMRYWQAECQNVNIARRANDVSHCGWSAGFYMAKPFATDGTTAQLITPVVGATGASQQFAVNNIGTYLAEGYITLTLTGIEPNVSQVDIVLGNPSSNEYITIRDTFLDGDVIVIDSANQQVFRNSQLLNPIGNFPSWAPGSGLLDYSDTATTRTLSIDGTYDPRYL